MPSTNEGHCGYFQVLAVMVEEALNIDVEIFVWT